jgi:hypothetical protein
MLRTLIVGRAALAFRPAPHPEAPRPSAPPRFFRLRALLRGLRRRAAASPTT